MSSIVGRSDRLSALASRDLETFTAATYLVLVPTRHHHPGMNVRRTLERRKRYLPNNPFKRLGEKVRAGARLRRFGGTIGVILYTYFTVNGKYRNYWRRVLLLDGPKRGKIVSV